MNPLFHMLFQQQRVLINKLNDVLKEYDLFHAQWTILFVLHEQGPMTLTAIWKYLNVEAPTVTRTVARLEQLGWVKRETGFDKREKIVDLTTKALTAFPVIESSIIQFEEEMVKGLNESEQQQLIALLQKMKG
ncbi:MarR family transcriptional regulator [Solibacillus sp. CAU 1738]|uniref:MarR family winged helix-turn-helix transcriptional regulator n=1 Tax=Solibacillus sp. CAU 1738 TaxID=3140363 RepID=UPI00326169CF